MSNDFDSMTIEELINVKSKIESLIEKRQKEKKIELNKAFKKMASDAGLTVDDILSSVKERKPAELPTILYRKDGKEYHGRGRKAGWVKQAEQEGNLEEYRVK